MNNNNNIEVQISMYTNQHGLFKYKFQIFRIFPNNNNNNDNTDNTLESSQKRGELILEEREFSNVFLLKERIELLKDVFHTLQMSDEISSY